MAILAKIEKAIVEQSDKKKKKIVDFRNKLHKAKQKL